MSTTDTYGDQTIRYEMDKIHGRTYISFSPIIFTAIAEGEYDIKTFIKAENIKPIYRKIKLNIKEEIPAEEIPEDEAPF